MVRRHRGAKPSRLSGIRIDARTGAHAQRQVRGRALRQGAARRHAGCACRHGAVVHDGIDGLGRGGKDHAHGGARDRRSSACGHLHGFGRRAHAGRPGIAHADGEGICGDRAPWARRFALRVGAYRSDDGRRDRIVRDGRRHHPCRAPCAHRVRRKARDPGHDSQGFARRLPNGGIRACAWAHRRYRAACVPASPPCPYPRDPCIASQGVRCRIKRRKACRRSLRRWEPSGADVRIGGGGALRHARAARTGGAR